MTNHLQSVDFGLCGCVFTTFSIITARFFYLFLSFTLAHSKQVLCLCFFFRTFFFLIFLNFQILAAAAAKKKFE